MRKDSMKRGNKSNKKSWQSAVPSHRLFYDRMPRAQIDCAFGDDFHWQQMKQAIPAGKALLSVTLPQPPQLSGGQMHLFAVGLNNPAH